MSDVGFLHELRDAFLGSGAHRIDKRLQQALHAADLISADACVAVDASHFAETYGSSVLRLDKLTPHQAEMLKECFGHRLVQLRAAAGAGKTFVALHLMQEFIEQQQDKRVLFVAHNVSLAYTVAKWLRTRWEHAYGSETACRLLGQLFVMCDPFDEGPRVLGESDDRLWIKTEPQADGAFAMVVVDEAHHIYRHANEARAVEAHVAAETRCIYLTDVSQSEETVLFPPGLKVVELTKVVRSSQRIVAGAAAFQVGGTTSECDHGVRVCACARVFMSQGVQQASHHAR